MWRRGVKNLNNVAIKVIFSPYVNIKLRMQKNLCTVSSYHPIGLIYAGFSNYFWK
jgi:hypothetical protein